MTRVRNYWGRTLPCCWSDCQSPGDTAHERKVPHDAPRFKGEMLVYVFCSEIHARMWSASSTGRATHGNLPSGERASGGLILP